MRSTVAAFKGSEACDSRRLYTPDCATAGGFIDPTVAAFKHCQLSLPKGSPSIQSNSLGYIDRWIPHG